MPATATDRIDGVTTSVAVKAPCVTVATSNITLSGLQTISGVTLAEHDRVLVSAQTNSVDNGVYNASSGSWTRAKDFDGNRDAVQGTRVLVALPGSSSASEYELTSSNPIVIGTTALTFVLRYGANATYDRTPAEIAAGVVPVNLFYLPGDVRRYGAIADFNGLTGTDCSVAFANAFLVARQFSPGGSIAIRSSGTNQYLIKTALTWPDYVGIICDPDIYLWYDDTASPGSFFLTIGAAGARHGQCTAPYLRIILKTPTACGLKLLNSVGSKFGVVYIENGDGAGRTGIGLHMEATPSTGACWFNEFDDLYVNTHVGIRTPSASAGYLTNNKFKSYRYYGNYNGGDVTSIAGDFDTASYLSFDLAWLEQFQTGFKLVNCASWCVLHGIYDVTSPAIAINISADCTTNRFLKTALVPDCIVLNGASASRQNVIDDVYGATIGSNFAQAHQSFLGLNDGQGWISPGSGLFAGCITIANVVQTLQGACYCPSNNLLYCTSRQGKLLAFSPQLQLAVSAITVTSTVGDSNPISCCYCPTNGLIYVANRADNKLVSVNPKTNTVVQQLDLTLTAGANCQPFGVAYCPFNGKIYVTNATTQNISIVTPTNNATDSVAQTLGGFATTLWSVAYCPITQKIYVGGNTTSIFIVTATTNATDSIAQTLAAGLTTGCFAIAYCPRNEKMYAASSGGATAKIINPTTGGADTVIQTLTLTVGGISANANRGISYHTAANCMLIASGNNTMASVLCSASGTVDVVTQVQGTAGGTTMSVVYHPSTAKVYELNPGLSTIYEWS